MENLEKSNGKIGSIELLKFIAAIFITNSHFKHLYVEPYTAFGTLGAPGNALFFFVSGYTLMLGRNDAFNIWYKRRIGRIWPSLFAWCTLVGPVIFEKNYGWKDIWLGGNFWFIQCIAIYYIFFYYLRSFIKSYFRWIMSGAVVCTVTYFLFFQPITTLSIYTVGFHYVCFFSIMLLGAYLATKRGELKKRKLWLDFLLSIIMLGLFYACQAIGKGKTGTPYYMQIFSLLPLHGFIYYIYMSMTGKWTKKILCSAFGLPVRIIASLTLEIYLVGFCFVYMVQFNNLFPLNLFIVFLILVATAYIVKVVCNFITQTISPQAYDWEAIIKPY
ncbi:MAG: acyltransferase [Prevotella sp.]|nr:acyltransferase [Prevotella sp.]